MRFIRRRMHFGFAATIAAFALSAATSETASATEDEASARTWTLVDANQRVCVQRGTPFTYFWIVLAGTWSTSITVGAQNVPAGATSSSVAIPPGSGDGHVVQAGVFFNLPSALPLGVYTPQLWATDGESTQTVPVTISVKDNCY